MKYESNRAFSTLDTLTLVGSVVLVALVIGPILSRRINQQYMVEAAKQAQIWTEKIPVDEKLSDAGLRISSQRGVASSDESAATTGSDPWGKPYQYHFIRNSYGQPVYIAVWSSGPNAISETSSSKLSLGSDGSMNVQFMGDDVGFVRALR
jgi:hypothetical protein